MLVSPPRILNVLLPKPGDHTIHLIVEDLHLTDVEVLNGVVFLLVIPFETTRLQP